MPSAYARCPCIGAIHTLAPKGCSHVENLEPVRTRFGLWVFKVWTLQGIGDEEPAGGSCGSEASAWHCRP